jgi:hypothetical protein
VPAEYGYQCGSNVEYRHKARAPGFFNEEYLLVTVVQRLSFGGKSWITATLSKVDAAHFKRLYGVSSVLLPNGVDAALFEGVTENQIQEVRRRYDIGENTLLFMGSYEYTSCRCGG